MSSHCCCCGVSSCNYIHHVQDFEEQFRNMGKDKGHNKHKRFQSKPYNKSNWRGQKQDRPHKSNGSSFNKTNSQPKSTLLENQVGITEFTNSDLPGFTGILKSRFSDFHVNEIDTKGQVLELSDLSVPRENETAPIEPAKAAEWEKELESVIGEKLWAELAEIASADYKSSSERKVEVDVSQLDKEQRTHIHQLVKQLYKGKLVSTTTSQPPANEGDEEKKFIRVARPKPGRSDNRWSFPGDYVTFLVHKTNVDTSEVAATLASKLNLRPSQVNYCGTKDKRAKTTQSFCIKHRTPKSILNAGRTLRNVNIGNFAFQSATLKLGDLQGNRFRIALRHICDERSDIESALQSLRERGFINYYGLQRFGNSATVPTYQIGVALLKRDYKLACELILKPRDNDVEFMRVIREAWWENRDSAAAAAKFHGDKFIEKKLLDGLARFGEQDFAAALRRIPRNMLLLYPHAYQSLIFNRIASRRIKEHGLKVIVGDLVYNEKQEPEEPMLDCEADSAEVDDVDSSLDNAEDDTQIEEESIFKRKVRPLTEEDVLSGNYKLWDVVLPLPGYDITYPSNEVGTWYEQMLAEDGLSSELLRHKDKTYALGGAYRKLLIHPSDLQWQFRSYKTPEDTLIASDWEQLKKVAVTPEPEELDAKYTALLLEFSLPTAAYATMFLRELLKKDTSTATQIQLEKEALNDKPEQEKEVIKAAEEEPTTIADEAVVSAEMEVLAN